MVPRKLLYNPKLALAIEGRQGDGLSLERISLFDLRSLFESPSVPLISRVQWWEDDSYI